jgi:hypothetical protein
MAMLIVLGLFGLFAAGTALGRSSADPVALTIAKPKFADGKWKEGYLYNARIKLTGTVGAPATLTASVRPKERAGSPWTKTFDVNAGPWSQAVNLWNANNAAHASQPLPGLYSVTVIGRSGDAPLPKVQADVTIKAPPEGVVDHAVVSAKRGGRGVTWLNGSPHEAWARFHFLSPPPGTRIVGIQWRTPNNKLVCQLGNGNYLPGCTLYKRLPPSNTIDTFIRSRPGSLPTGKWYAQVSVGKRIGKKTFVRIR